jgi:hypothetical protein
MARHLQLISFGAEFGIILEEFADRPVVHFASILQPNIDTGSKRSVWVSGVCSCVSSVTINKSFFIMIHS